MALLNRVKNLFSRTSKVPSLSSFTVDHSKLDEFILNDMVDHSRRFKNAITTPVEYEKEDGSRETYEQATNLRSDLFFAHHVATDAVQTMGRDQVRPSAQLNAEIMEAFIQHPDFLKTRPMTRSDEVASTLSTMAAQQALDDELRTSLKEQVETANQAGQHEADIEKYEQMLKDLRDKVRELREQGLDIPEELKQAIKGAVRDKQNAQQQLEDVAPGGRLPGCGGVAVHEAAAKAAGEAKELAEVYMSLPGVGIGAGQRIAPEAAIELAYRWRDAPDLKRMTDLLGRLERDFRYKRANRVVGGDDIIVGVEVGNEVRKLLPMEYLGLAVPELESKFYRDFASRQLLQYEMIGEAEASRGPIVICIDASGSMAGAENEWARAVALALTSIAHRERRPVYIIEFSHNVTGEWEFKVKGGIDPEVATDFACSFDGGGTDITSALIRAKEICDKHPSFKSADVVLITDGSDYMDEDDLELKRYFNERGVRLQGIVIGMDSTPYTSTICDDEASVYDLTGSNDATDKIVTGLTG